MDYGDRKETFCFLFQVTIITMGGGGGGYVFLVVTANSVNIHDKLFRMRNGIVDMKGDISR